MTNPIPDPPFSALSQMTDVDASQHHVDDGASYSALSLYQVPSEEIPTHTERRPALLPWWINPLAALALLAILAYQTCIPTRMKRRCIYTPSCSRYCQIAIRQYGLVRGLLYFWQRWKRCNGARFQGGHDPP